MDKKNPFSCRKTPPALDPTENKSHIENYYFYPRAPTMCRALNESNNGLYESTYYVTIFIFN